MSKSFLLFFVPVTFLLTVECRQPPSTARIESDLSDSLMPYTSCRFSGGLSIVEVLRLPGSGLRYRIIQTPDGQRRVSMLDGYRMLLAIPGSSYFANLHVEKSEPSQYPADKDAVIKSFGTLVSQSGAPMRAVHRNYNGFDAYASSDLTMEGRGQTGTYVLFRDSEHLIVTIYLIDQKPSDRKFRTLDEYQALRDRFLEDLVSCLNEGAAKKK